MLVGALTLGVALQVSDRVGQTDATLGRASDEPALHEPRLDHPLDLAFDRVVDPKKMVNPYVAAATK